MSNRKSLLLGPGYWSLVVESMVRKEIKGQRNPGAERKELRARNEQPATGPGHKKPGAERPGFLFKVAGYGGLEVNFPHSSVIRQVTFLCRHTCFCYILFV